MKGLVALLLALVVATSCASKKEEEKGGKSDWPDGISAFFTPEDRIVKHDQKVRMWAENKTGEEYAFEWTGEGKCGELQWKKETGFEAVFVGGQLGEDCNEKLTLKVMGPKGTFDKQFGVKVEGSQQFAQLEVRPNPIPESWSMVNDYDKTLKGREVKCVTRIGGKEAAKPSVGLAVDATKKRKKSKEEEEREKKAREAGEETEIVDYFDDVQLNLLDAPFGEWNFEFANCFFDAAPAGDEGVLAFKYDLPHHDDYCGYFENLKVGEDCETQPYDTSEFTHLTFIAKSGDDKSHRLHVEMINWERFAEFHQGRPESVGPFDVTDKWQRYEIPLGDLYKDTLNPSGIKSVSFKIKREANFPDHGLILFDNVAFMKKEGANP